MDATLCSQLALADKKMALNASDSDDECPICGERWCEFVEPTVAAILPCNHSCCAPCLVNYFNSCKASSGNEACTFGCPLCRLRLSDNIFDDLAHAFLDRNLIDSFEFLAEKLACSRDYLKNLVVSLLVKTHKFDLSKVEFTLFNMVGLMDPNPNESLNAEEKQSFFERARAPVKQLYKELCEIRKKLSYIDVQSSKGAELRLAYDLTHAKCQQAMQNASRDIFERVNYRANFIVRREGIEIACVDLHGQYIDEARHRLDEFILPVLEAYKQIMVITGYGAHSQNGRAGVLKDAVKLYFAGLNYRCEDLPNNYGAFYVLADS